MIRLFEALCTDCEVPMVFYNTADQQGWAMEHSCTHKGHTVTFPSGR